MNRNRAQNRCPFLSLFLSRLCLLMGIGLLGFMAVSQSPTAFGQAPSPAAAAGEAAPASLEQALALIEDGKDAPAASLLEGLVGRTDRASPEGGRASYLLVEAYGSQGRYQEALKEAELLLASLPAIAPAKEATPPSNLAGSNSLPHLPAAADGSIRPVPTPPPAAVNPPAAANPQDPDHEEIEALCEILRSSLAKPAGGAEDQVLRLSGRADVAAYRERPADALAGYTAAYHALLSQSGDSQALDFFVEKKLLTALMALPPGERAKIVPGVAFPMIEGTGASLERRKLGLSSLRDLCEIFPEGPAAARLERDMDALLAAPAPTGDRSLIELAKSLLPGLQERRATSALLRAQGEEREEHWTQALALFRDAAAMQAPPGQEEIYRQVREEGIRSIPLMQSLESGANGAPGFRFLGIDSTCGRDWRGQLGQDAWVIPATYNGNNLCGGSLLLESAFSFRARVGDQGKAASMSSISPMDWKKCAGIVPLADPLLQGSRIMTGLGDRGKSCPPGCGPDLYLDLTIPEGRRLLSFPLLFTGKPHGPEAFGLYLLSGEPGSAAEGTPDGGPLRCLAHAIYPYAAPQGGLVRAAVQGPARITLLIRRWNSAQINLPAFFLDPDPRFARAAPLAKRLSEEDFRAARLKPDEAQPGGLAALGQDPGTLALLDLARQYASLDNTIAAIDRKSAPEDSSLNSGDNAGDEPLLEKAASADWTGLAEAAGKFAEDPSHPASERAVAARIAYQAQKRCPLGVGEVGSGLLRFLNLRLEALLSPSGSETAGPTAPAEAAGIAADTLAGSQDLQGERPSLPVEAGKNLALLGNEGKSPTLAPPIVRLTPGLSRTTDPRAPLFQQHREYCLTLAQTLRQEGRIDLARVADEEAWRLELCLAQALPRSTLIVNWEEHKAMVERLWREGPLPYIARQRLWLWQGENGPLPVPASCALDADYAARRTSEIVRALLHADHYLFRLGVEYPSRSSALPYGNLAAGMARSFIDDLHHEPPALMTPEDAPRARPSITDTQISIQQPIDAILYAAASEPLLGEAAPALSPELESLASWGDSIAASAGKDQPCLLAPAEMEQLAYAWSNRDLFPTFHHLQDLARARQLVETLSGAHPEYGSPEEVSKLKTDLSRRYQELSGPLLGSRRVGK